MQAIIRHRIPIIPNPFTNPDIVFYEYDTFVGFTIIEPYTVQINDIHQITGLNKLELPFCSPGELYDALAYINTDTLERIRQVGLDFRLEPGRPCRSYIPIPGSELITGIPNEVGPYVKSGYIVNLVLDESVIGDEKRISCCTSPTMDCPTSLHNMYTTSSCDDIMVDFCKTNSNNSQCLQWLGTRREAPLNLYQNICISEYPSDICTVFTNEVRQDPRTRGLGDIVLKNYCDANATDPNCSCFAPPKSLQKIALEQNAPYECWYSACNINTKYLTYRQMITKRDCSYSDCYVSLGNISTNGEFTISNYCASINNFQYVTPSTPGEDLKTAIKTVRKLSFVDIKSTLVVSFLAATFASWASLPTKNRSAV